MSRIESEMRIAAPREKVWAVLADFGGIVNYNSNLSASRLIGTQTAGVNMQRHCDLTNGAGFDERVTRWDEGRGYHVDMLNFKGMPPIQYARAEVGVRDAGTPGQSVAVFALDYQLGMGPLGALMDAAMAKRQFEKTAQRLLASLKYHVETGQRATREAVTAYLKSAA